jgi:hypothetical protein
MVERGKRSGEPGVPAENGAERPLTAFPEQLEQRVRRLEEAVAGLQDTRLMEDRIVQRVTEKVAASQGNKEGTESARGRNGERTTANSPVSPARQVSDPPLTNRHGWWFFEAYQDLRAMIRMFSDRRYRHHMTWTAFLTPFVLVVCILAVWFLMPTSLPIVGPLLRVFDKLVDLVLAFFAYKILLREVRRYQDMIPQ